MRIHYFPLISFKSTKIPLFPLVSPSPVPFEAAPSPSQIPGSTNQGHLAVIKQRSSGNQTWQVKIPKKNIFIGKTVIYI